MNYITFSMQQELSSSLAIYVVCFIVLLVELLKKADFTLMDKNHCNLGPEGDLPWKRQ